MMLPIRPACFKTNLFPGRNSLLYPVPLVLTQGPAWYSGQCLTKGPGPGRSFSDDAECIPCTPKTEAIPSFYLRVSREGNLYYANAIGKNSDVQEIIPVRAGF
jgi:hypothetical protein